MLVEVILIVISSTLFNHLGLAEKLTFNTKVNVVINCSKCLTFWSVLSYCLYLKSELLYSITSAFIASYSALWLEVALSYLSTIYNKCYAKIYKDNQEYADKGI